MEPMYKSTWTKHVGVKLVRQHGRTQWDLACKDAITLIYHSLFIERWMWAKATQSQQWFCWRWSFNLSERTWMYIIQGAKKSPWFIWFKDIVLSAFHAPTDGLLCCWFRSFLKNLSEITSVREQSSSRIHIKRINKSHLATRKGAFLCGNKPYVLYTNRVTTVVGCDRWVSSSHPLSQGRFLSSPSLFRLVGHKPKRNWWISIHLGFLKGLFQNVTLVRLSADELRSRSLPKIAEWI